VGRKGENQNDEDSVTRLLSLGQFLAQSNEAFTEFAFRRFCFPLHLSLGFFDFSLAGGDLLTLLTFRHGSIVSMCHLLLLIRILV